MFREDDTDGEWVEAVGAYHSTGGGRLPEWGFE
jgi:hypothetical protein